MRKIMTCILLSLFISVGTGEVFASVSNDRGGDRKEQRDKGKNHDKGNKHHNRRPGNKKDKHNKKDKDFRPGRGGHSLPAPGHNAVRPAPGHRPAPAPVHRPPHRPHHYVPAPPPPGLGPMVSHATRGCRDVAVWQVDHDTYVVKYRRGKKYYTQYLYPYAGRYGDRSLISVNWQPLSPWTLIPPIQLNINL